jgi:hypothetical protein
LLAYGSEPEDSNLSFIKASRRVQTVTYPEAMASNNASAWIESQTKEINQLHDKEVIEEIDTPPGVIPIPIIWALVIKFDAEGNFEKFKSRAVAQGFRQIPGKDFEETYANVPTLAAVRFCFALDCYLKLEPRQLDIVGAYLEAPLHQTVYAKPPPGFELAPGKCWLLKKALYGLHQAGHEFAIHRDTLLEQLGYIQSKVEPSFFMKFVDGPDGSPPTLDYHLFHVDDDKAGISEDGTGRAQHVIDELKSVFPIEDMGIPKSYLGISIGYNTPKRLAYLYQPGLIDQIVGKMRLNDAKPATTPLQWNVAISPNTGPTHPGFHSVSFPSILGAINYLACATRPDVSNAVRVLASHAAKPSKSAWFALNWLVRYLKGTRNQVLVFGLDLPFDFAEGSSRPSMQNAFTVFSDSDYASENDRMSISGYISMLYGSPIGWSSKKQTGTVALSSMEAEVIAGCLGTKEALYMRKLWSEIESYDLIYPVNLAIDNQAAIYFGNANADHKRVKHIDIRYQFIRTAVNAEVIRLWYCPSTHNPADLFTKGFRADRHSFLMRLIGMRRIEEVC